ncbi:MAG: transglutaminase domain-containing protein [Kofleriaceae bacterium]
MKCWCVVLAVGACGWVGGEPAHAAPSALDKPAFTATPSELLAAAEAVTEGDAPVVVLRREEELSLDDQDRTTRRSRWVYVMLSDDVTGGWNLVGKAWNSAYQDPPSIRARAIYPGGKVIEAGPAQIETVAVYGQDSETVWYSRAPVRGGPGTVVEYEIVVRDKTTRSTMGTLDQLALDISFPTLSSRVSISAPVARQPSHAAPLLPAGIRPASTTAAGRQTWTYELGALPVPSEELFVPDDIVVAPTFVISTGRSWNAVARDARGLLERRIAEGPVAVPAALPRTATLEAVRAIAGWLHARVRTTGACLGDRALDAAPPAKTLARRAGGCMDKALLLLALLRDAGVRADLALVSTEGRDVIDPALAGLGPFEHPVVRAWVGDRAVWIDASAELALPGELPGELQGRPALVLAEDATAPTETPRSSSSDNQHREVRTYQLSELGPATRVQVVQQWSGALAERRRVELRDRGVDAARERFDEVAAVELGGVLGRVHTTRSAELAAPLQATFEVARAHMFTTGLERIEIDLRVAGVVGDARAVLLSDSWPEPGKRRQPLTWRVPHVSELEHRFVVPMGFERPALPPGQTHALGPARLTETYRMDGDAIVVALRFDTGKPRMAATEAAEMRRAFQAIAERKVHLVLENTALRLSREGKPREALAELQRQLARHPREAAHQIQLATVLVEHGMGAAARRAARKAAALEPKRPESHAVLGWVLQHDTLGRLHGFDHDRAGALAALARARALQPDHVGASEVQADLLQRDARGVAFGPGSDPRAASNAWAAAFEATDEPRYGMSRAIALWRAGHAGEAEEVLRVLPATKERDALLVAVIATARGAKAAVDEAAKLGGSASRSTLEAAAAGLVFARRYDEIRALLGKGGGALGLALPADVVARLQRVDLAPADPRHAFLDMMRILSKPDHQTAVFWDEATEAALRQFLRTEDLRMRAIAGYGDDVARDILAATSRMELDGNEATWRLRATVHGRHYVVYLALDGGRAKVVSATGMWKASGRHLLRLLARGDEATAARMVDWLAEAEPQGISKMWGAGKPRDRDAIAVIAAIAAGASEVERIAPNQDR